MNATFAALLEVAYAYGGGLLKFGGDALLLFFDAAPGGAQRGRGSRAYGTRVAVELVGTPGLGKTRLTEEIHSYCEGMPLFTSRCAQYEPASPYHRVQAASAIAPGGRDGRRRGEQSTALAERVEMIEPELTRWSPLLAAALDIGAESTPRSTSFGELESGDVTDDNSRRSREDLGSPRTGRPEPRWLSRLSFT